MIRSLALPRQVAAVNVNEISSVEKVPNIQVSNALVIPFIEIVGLFFGLLKVY